MERQSEKAVRIHSSSPAITSLYLDGIISRPFESIVCLYSPSNIKFPTFREFSPTIYHLMTFYTYFTQKSTLQWLAKLYIKISTPRAWRKAPAQRVLICYNYIKFSLYLLSSINNKDNRSDHSHSRNDHGDRYCSSGNQKLIGSQALDPEPAETIQGDIQHEEFSR